MKKWKLLLGAIGAITPLAISTPFIVGCSKSEKQEEAPKRYRYFVIRSAYYNVYLQVFTGYDNYFNEIWENVDSGTAIYPNDWDKFVQQANEANIPIVYK